jgi:hypothetical protein
LLKCHREKTYGVPFACISFNVVWEFLWSFNLVDQDLFWFFEWGNRFWLVIDILLFYQLLKYGRKEMQAYPLIQKHFLKVVAFAAVLNTIGLVGFTTYFGDFTGSASSMSMNLVMSILFIFFLFARWDDLRGISYPAAWLKMIGTGAAGVFLVTWLPAQYEGGLLTAQGLVREPTVHAPEDYLYMYFLYVTIFVVDCIFIAILHARRKELKQQARSSST